MRIRPFISLIAAFWASPAISAEIHPSAPSSTLPVPTATGQVIEISLADAIALGLRDNRTIKSAYLLRQAQKFDFVVANRIFLPTAEIDASAGSSRSIGAPVRTATLSPSATWKLPTGAQLQFSWSRVQAKQSGAMSIGTVSGITVTQPLLKGAGGAVNDAPRRIAELQEQINRQSLRANVSSTVTNIALAYRALQEAQDQERLAREALDRSTSLIATNKALISAGRVAAADLLQNQSDAASQQVAVLQSQQQTNSARIALLQLLALDLHSDLVAKDAVEATHVDIDETRAVDLGLSGRSDILQQTKAIEQAKEAARVARNSELWDVSIVAGGTDTHNITTAVGSIPIEPTGANRTVGIQVKIPLGDYSSKQAAQQAGVNLKTQELALDDLKQSAEAQIRDAVTAVEISWKQVEAARQARDLAYKTVEAARDKLKAGRASNFEVLSFETSYRAASSQELEANISYLNALTVLDQQLGTTLDSWHIDLND